MPARSSQQRQDATPLLRTVSKPKQRRFRLFQSRSTEMSPQRPQRTLDTRQLKVPLSSMSSEEETFVEEEAVVVRQPPPRAAATYRPRVLHENAKDSSKKPRPFPVALRRRSFDGPDPPTNVKTPKDEEEKKDGESQAVQHLSPLSSSIPQDLPRDILDGPMSSISSDLGDRDHKTASDTSSTFRSLPATPNGSKERHAIQEELSRPFARPPAKWIVEVSAAEWMDSVWKYRILVQTRQLSKVAFQQPMSFTNAFTYRTLADFVWLEQSLHKEYQGALLVPSLATALGRPARADSDSTPVEPVVLKDWLFDVLNGFRGHGEVQLDTPDLMQSVAMESFLYKSTSPQDPEDVGFETAVFDGEPSLFRSLFTKPLEFCVGTEPDVAESPRSQKSIQRLPVDIMTCSSRALSTSPSLDVQDSILDAASTSSPANSPSRSSRIIIHSEVLEAQAELVASYRVSTASAISHLKALKDEEEWLGQIWKRFSLALSNLFAYEKDVENARLGDMKINRENMLYRKVAKTSLEDCMRDVAKHKSERSVPALDLLLEMLQACAVDWSAVAPSLDAFNRAASKLSFQGKAPAIREQYSERSPDATTITSWDDRLKLIAMTVDDVKQTAIKSFQPIRHTPESSPRRKSHRAPVISESERQQLRESLFHNEQLFQKSLTALCCTMPWRTARVAWAYWNTEATHCSRMATASKALYIKLNVVNPQSVTDMINRHMEEEKGDNLAELDIITRIVNIRVNKFSPPSDGSSIVDDVVEVENDENATERERGIRRARALDIAKERVGKWDSKLSLAIMEAVEVDDPNVRVDETTRDLRLIRKYAIGLRDHLNRCVEAIQLLRSAYSPAGRPDSNSRSSKGVFEKRRELLDSMAKLFSGKYVRGERGPKRYTPSMAVLARSGIDTTDALGWSGAWLESTEQRRQVVPSGTVGELAVQYLKVRDAQTEWLLKSMYDLLNDYFDRVESIEGFVYMECVGIQLEKHFSQERASALSAFEKKTDITAAMNVATRKRLPKLVKELQAKLNRLGPEVSHTQVKESKEMHLEAKNVKAELHDLAVRRLTRAREASTEKVVNLMALWAKEEENSAVLELQTLGRLLAELERSVQTGSLRRSSTKTTGNGLGTLVAI